MIPWLCRGWGYLHVHVGPYPNWFQVRLEWPNLRVWPWETHWRLVVTREDNR
jgi:hypothetical protein